MQGSLHRNTVLLARRLRDRITVEYDPPGGGVDISHKSMIDGMSGVIENGTWHVTYTLSSAEAYDDNLVAAPSTWLILDDGTLGKLDTGKLGY